jgi:hypothetical protein
MGTRGKERNGTESPRKGPRRILWDHIRRAERGLNGEGENYLKKERNREKDRNKRRKETELTHQRRDGKEKELFVLEEQERTKAGGDKRVIRRGNEGKECE